VAGKQSGKKGRHGLELTKDWRREPLIGQLHWLIKIGVRILAVLMVMLIFWGIGDIIWVMFTRLREPPVFILRISDILAVFGAFLAVLIAIEIFENIILYLRDDVIHVQLVVATALMAISRKVIVFDFKEIKAEFVWATAAVILALGITYWLLSGRVESKQISIARENPGDGEEFKG